LEQSRTAVEQLSGNSWQRCLSEDDARLPSSAAPEPNNSNRSEKTHRKNAPKNRKEKSHRKIAPKKRTKNAPKIAPFCVLQNL
jgi:hypothetical protein